MDHAELEIRQGDDFVSRVQVYLQVDDQPEAIADLTGYTAMAQIRRDAAERSASVIAELACSIPVAAEGIIVLNLHHDVTAAVRSGHYVWDLQLISETGIVVTIIGGPAVVTSEVTRLTATA